MNYLKKLNKIIPSGAHTYSRAPEGIKLRTRLTLEFMKRKIDEYNELKKELKLERKKKIKIKKKN